MSKLQELMDAVVEIKKNCNRYGTFRTGDPEYVRASRVLHQYLDTPEGWAAAMELWWAITETIGDEPAQTPDQPVLCSKCGGPTIEEVPREGTRQNALLKVIRATKCRDCEAIIPPGTLCFTCTRTNT